MFDISMSETKRLQGKLLLGTDINLLQTKGFLIKPQDINF